MGLAREQGRRRAGASSTRVPVAARRLVILLEHTEQCTSAESRFGELQDCKRLGRSAEAVVTPVGVIDISLPLYMAL